jgi:hypothetical protein
VSDVLKGGQSVSEHCMMTREPLAMRTRWRVHTFDSCCAGRKSFEENMIGDVCGIDAKGAVERLLSKSTHVPAAIAAGRRTRRRHPSTESPPTAITSASEKSTDSELFSLSSRDLATINTVLHWSSHLCKETGASYWASRRFFPV